MEPMTHRGDLGIKMLDRDHREISELLLDINFNAAEDRDPGPRIHRLKQLARISQSHFRLEEGMMAASKYPGLALHTLRHEWMMEQIHRLAASLGKNQSVPARVPIGLLWESHTAHIESEDRAFSLWLDGRRASGVVG